MPSAKSNRPHRPTTALASDVELPRATDDQGQGSADAQEVDEQGGLLSRHGQELAGIGVATLAVLIFVSLMSYQPASPPEPAGNLIGPAGVFFADTTYWLLGASSYFFVLLAAAGARSLFARKRLFGRWEEAAGYGLGLLMVAMLLELVSPDARWFGHQLGGWMGEGLAIATSAIVGRVGATVCGVSMLLMAFVLITESSVVAVAGAIWSRIAAWGEGVSRDAPPRHTDSELVPVGPRLRYDAGSEALDPPAISGLPVSARQSSAAVPIVDETEAHDDDFDPSASEAGIAAVAPAAESGRAEEWAFDDEAAADDEFEAEPEPEARRSLTGSIVSSISRFFGRGAKPARDVAPDLDDDANDDFEIGDEFHDGVATRSSEWATGWSIGHDNAADDSYSAYADDDDDFEDDVDDASAIHTALPASSGKRSAEDAPVFAFIDSVPADEDSGATGIFKRADVAPVAHHSTSDDLRAWQVDSDGSSSSPSAVIRRQDTGASLPKTRTSPSPVPRALDAPPVEPEVSSQRPVVTDDAQSVWVKDLKMVTPARNGSERAASVAAAYADETGDNGRPSTMQVSSADVVSVQPADAVAAGPVIFESEALMQRKRAEDLDRELPRHRDSEAEWQFPPMSFLRYEESPENAVDHERLKELAVRLEEVLASFKVLGKVTGICPGPVVTRFEFEPETGTKLSKISGLSDDIAMALKAVKVRIIAPIPGKGCVGIEVPNDTRENVFLKEILADERFVRSRSPLTVALGKDIEGFPVVADFAKMPHLLIAGTTGSGKSVTVNAMITSILYNASPDDVKMILIDPKQLEFAIYQDMPHLMLPVVTDPAKANTALQWAVTEMELRYKLMAEMRVRNLAGYNQKLKELERNAIDAIADPSIRDPQIELLDQVDENDELLHKRMYYIVIIVDEFADLMMTSGKEVEVAVARLAQKARAAGIHIMLATQRPSVDVLTGVIKSNFPTRMSCRLMSGTDSRTVLDSIGAENLLGMGDMLYRPNGSQDLIRVHGAYVDEREIEHIVDFLKKQRPAKYDERILAPPASDDGGADDEPMDECYEEAVQCVIDAGFASISMLQRHLRMGYNRAARMVDAMEREGIIGPSTGGSARREVLVGQLFKN